jgi:hypothetical protein
MQNNASTRFFKEPGSGHPAVAPAFSRETLFLTLRKKLIFYFAAFHRLKPDPERLDP